jgi:hypothetical protein
MLPDAEVVPVTILWFTNIVIMAIATFGAIIIIGIDNLEIRSVDISLAWE